MGPIGSTVLTFIGYKQTNRHLDKPNLYIDFFYFSYAGFGDANLSPAPPVGFNLTFRCPEGQVFDNDWFATPFVMSTCQVIRL